MPFFTALVPDDCLMSEQDKTGSRCVINGGDGEAHNQQGIVVLNYRWRVWSASLARFVAAQVSNGTLLGARKTCFQPDKSYTEHYDVYRTTISFLFMRIQTHKLVQGKSPMCSYLEMMDPRWSAGWQNRWDKEVIWWDQDVGMMAQRRQVVYIRPG